MKKNKTIAYLMAATLLVGGAFVGTKAWFSDQVTTDNGITITMGTLDLELKENGAEEEGQNQGWKLVRDGKEESNVEGSKNGNISKVHTNIRPGDVFERTITVTNVGSLDQTVKVEHVGKGYDEGFFALTTKGPDLTLIKNGEFTLNKGESKEITLRLSTTPENLNNNEQDTTFNFEELSQITLTGRQINANENQLSK